MPKQRSLVPVAFSLGDPVSSAKTKAKAVRDDVTASAKNQGVTKDQVMAMLQKHQTSSSSVKANSLPGYAQLMADPLSGPLVGRPDDNSYATNTIRIPDVIQVSGTDTCVLVQPNLSLSHSASPTISAGALTSFGAGVDSVWKAQLNLDNGTMRVLCYVVQWIPTFSKQTGAGRIRMGTYQGTATGPGVSLGPLAGYFDDGGTGVVGAACDPCVIIARPFQPVPLLPPDSSFYTQLPNVFVVFTGMPAGTCGQLVVTRILEGSPVGGTLPSMTAKHTACDMNACCVASNIQGPMVTAQTGETAYEYLKKNGLKLAKAAVVDAAHWGASGFMPNVSKMLGG